MSDLERSLVDAWLRRHKVAGLELTPLVAARIAVRHRCERIEKRSYLALVAIAAAAAVVEGAVSGWDEPDPSPASSVLSISGSLLVLSVVTGVTFWLQRRADQRIARRLRERVTRPEAVNVTAILGATNLWALAVVYAGGILVGAGSAALVTAAEDRLLALAFVIGLILYSAFTIWWFTNVVRQPAIADDERSLRADDLLRRMDVRRALFPYPACLAAVAAVSAGGSGLLWVFLAYAAASVWVWGYTGSPAAPTLVTPGARA